MNREALKINVNEEIGYSNKKKMTMLILIPIMLLFLEL